MTGYTVHTGSSEKFSQGWDQIFGGSKKTTRTRSAIEQTESASAAPKKAKQSKSARPATAKKRSKSK